jgi:hypothetical protein
MVKPGDFCGFCRKPVVNFLQPHDDIGNCVDVAITRKILNVERFENEASKEDKASRIPPPVTSRGKLFGKREKTLKKNAAKACSVLRRWKRGFKDYIQRYIHFNQPELEDFLRDHLGIQIPQFPFNAPLNPRNPALTDNQHLEESVSSDDEIIDELVDSAALPLQSEIDASSSSDGESSANDEVHELDDFEDAEVADIRADILEAERLFDEKKYSLQYVLELFKAMKNISDASMTLLLGLLKKYKPVVNREYYEKLPSDGRSLCRPANQLLKGMTIRKVRCGLSVHDGRPIKHTVAVRPRKEKTTNKTGPPVPEEDEEEVVEAYSDNENDYVSPSEASSDGEISESDDYLTVQNSTTASQAGVYGDVVDFSIEGNIFLESAGNTNGKHHRAMLLRVNAAKPKLLSDDLLAVADPDHQYFPASRNIEGRSGMNHFALKLHVDGVQIAKNSTKSQAIPVLAAVDRIDPFDETAGETAAERIKSEEGICIPVHFAQPFIITIYHGDKKPDTYEFLKLLMEELDFLDPSLSNDEAMEVAKSQGKERGPRRVVVTITTACCDTPMKSWLTGMLKNDTNHLL